MKKLRFTDLSDISEGHFLSDKLPGKYIYMGKIDYGIPGNRSHSFDGPDGSDYHVHEDHEVFVIFQGKAMMEVDGSEYKLKTGDIIIIEPGEDHHFNVDVNEPCVYYWFHTGDKPHWEIKQ